MHIRRPSRALPGHRLKLAMPAQKDGLETADPGPHATEAGECVTTLTGRVVVF